jgi:hypothetical protein
METDALIQTLARDPQIKGPRMQAWLAISIAAALAYSVLAILVVAGARLDFMEHLPWVAGKAGLSLLFVLASVPLLLRLARPGGDAGAWFATLGALLVGCLMLVVGSLTSMPESERMFALTGGTFPVCAVIIPTMAAPTAAGLFLWLRKQAPTRPALAGMTAGILASALAAMAYALTCPVDSAAFVATWYPLAIMVRAAIGALVGRFAVTPVALRRVIGSEQASGLADMSQPNRFGAGRTKRHWATDRTLPTHRGAPFAFPAPGRADTQPPLCLC